MFSTGIPSTMMKGFTLIFFLHVCLFVAPSHSKYVVCYYSNWAQYRPSPGTFTVTNIDNFACTHIIFAFAQVKDNIIREFEYNDIDPPGMWRQFTAIKNLNVNVKVLLAVGGYNHNTTIFSNMAASAENRKKFIDSVIQLLWFYGFDGLDLDWEYPGDVPSDKDNFSTLIKETREAFELDAVQTNRKRLLLTAAVPAGIARLQKGYDIPILNKYLDLFNVMCYDYHGQWETFTGFTSPMNALPGDTLSVESTMNYYLEQGASKTKLVLGMALYARTFTLRNFGDSAPGSLAIANGGIAGVYTREPGVLSHYEVCSRLAAGYTQVLDPVAKINYAYKDNQWINYENETTLSTKIAYILANDLGGGMIWALDHDDFGANFCGRGRNPLLSLVSGRLISVPLVNNVSTTVASPSTTTTAEITTTVAITTPAETTTTAPTTVPTTEPVTTAPPAAVSTSTPGSDSTATDAMVPTRSSGYSPRYPQCPDMYGLHSDSSNCRSYFVCKFGVPFSANCADGQIFSNETRKCVSSTATSC
jgi:chitinase